MVSRLRDDRSGLGRFDVTPAPVVRTPARNPDGSVICPECGRFVDSTGWHIETVYRAIDRLEDLVEHHYGELSLRSHHIATQVAEYVQAACESVEDAVETLARSLEHEVGLELSNDALVEWIDQFGIDVEDRSSVSGSIVSYRGGSSNASLLVVVATV